MKSLGKASLRFRLPAHLSSQNLISLPFPTSQEKVSSKLFFHSSRDQTSFKSLHQRESVLLFLRLWRSLQPPYFESRTSFHKPMFSDPKRQIHLHNKAKLKLLKLITPSPQSSFDSQTFFHETQAIFLPSEPHPHKKFLCSLSISFITIASMLKRDKKNTGRADNTDLIKQSLLAIEINLPFHLLNLIFTFSTSSS